MSCTQNLTALLLTLSSCSAPQLPPSQPPTPDLLSAMESYHRTLIKESTHYNPQNNNIIIVRHDKPFNPLDTWEKILNYQIEFKGNIQSCQVHYDNADIICAEYQGHFFKFGTNQNITPEILSRSAGGPLDCPTYFKALNHQP